ncbi:MAG: D-2-hydroxyacid dehydrogenase [Sphaerobacter sp.]|nr:D-2-hydroxyacid dehydrogenase [Sphaerobacter sp.]
MAGEQERLTIFITSPLEVEHVERIRATGGERVEVIYDPELLPPTRYVADHDGREDFRRSPEQQARFDSYVARADILWDFPKNAPPGGGLLQRAPRLKWVQTTSAGVGQLVARLGLQESDLLVTTASGVHARPLAEFVFLALLMHVKELPRLQADQRAHRWQRFASDELSGKTLAIVGPGKIGREVARIARCFDMRVLAMGRTTTPERAAALGVDQLYPRERLGEMLAAADAVVLCCPHTPETENLIDRDAFAAMKDGVVFINIARGQVVDEDALIDALRSGKIAFAALDVFRTEPLPPDSPLWDLPNVLINPHSASTAYSENRRITDIFCHNLTCFLDGRISEMWNVLDKRRMY